MLRHGAELSRRKFGIVFGRTKGWLLGLVLLTAHLLLPQVAIAAPPVLKALQPPGAQRGQTFTLTLHGEGLVTGAEIITTLPAAISRLAPPKELQTPNTELSFLVQLSEGAEVGVYPVRFRTDDGLSNALIFTVGELPETAEKEPNDSLAQAQAVRPAVTINGSADGPDQDYYRFTAAAGERLVLEVEARRAGSAVDPVLEVFDSAGRRMRSNDDAPGLGVDARVEITFAKAGTYYALIHDAKYSEQTTSIYRLKIGSYAYAEGIFPLGGQRGKTLEVGFFGGNLAKPVMVRANLDVPAEQESVSVNLPGPRPLGTLPFQLRVGDLREVIAPEDGSVGQLEPSTVINGRISKRGEVDRYKLSVSPGQRWLVTLEAASLGTSRLYGLVTVYDTHGKKVSTRELGEGVEPTIAFAVPEKVQEVTLAVEDVRGLGGPTYAYRLCARPEEGDFTLKLLTPYVNVPAEGTAAIEVIAERHGYDGPIQLSIPDAPEDFTITGGNVAAEIVNYEGQRERSTVGYLTITATPDAKPRTLRLSVWGQGGPQDRPIRRRAQAPVVIFTVNGEEKYTLTADLIPARPVTFPWLGTGLAVSINRRLPATLEVKQKNVRALHAMPLAIEYNLVKDVPGTASASISSLQLPTVKDLGITAKADEKNPDHGTLTLTSTLDTPLVRFDVVAKATLQIDGKEETLVAPAVTVELVRAYTLALQTEHVELKGGGKVELAGTIYREPGYTGTVKIRVGDPPDKVNCPSVEVPDGKPEFRLVCEAAPDAQQGEFEVHLVSSATIPGRADKREYTHPPLAARMIVGSDKPTQAAANKAGL